MDCGRDGIFIFFQFFANTFTGIYTTIMEYGTHKELNIYYYRYLVDGNVEICLISYTLRLIQIQTIKGKNYFKQNI
jgi:hypothetical protein